MIAYPFKSLLFMCLIVLGCTSNKAQNPTSNVKDFNALSEQFLKDIKAGKDTKNAQDELANTTLYPSLSVKES